MRIFTRFLAHLLVITIVVTSAKLTPVSARQASRSSSAQDEFARSTRGERTVAGPSAVVKFGRKQP